MPWLTPGMRRGLLAVTCTGDWLAGAALKLGHLADAGWGRDEDGETQGRERQHANASYPITGHDQWPPI